MSSRFTLFAPWTLGVLALCAMGLITVLFGGANGQVSYAAATLESPFFAVWFLAAVAIAQRAVALPASRARAAAVIAIGGVLALPFAWKTPDPALAVGLAALLVAGEVFVAAGAARVFFPRRRLRFRNAVAALSFALFVLPPAITPVKFGVLPAFIVSIVTAASARLIALEQRHPGRIVVIRIRGLLLAAGLAAAGYAIGKAGPENPLETAITQRAWSHNTDAGKAGRDGRRV